MTGRPTALTPEVQATILEAIRAGNYKVTACSKAGIHRDTLHGWEQRASQGEEPYASFVVELQKAEAEAEANLLAEIRNAQPGVTGVSGPDPWQSRAWVMERRWPKRWAARVRQAVSEELQSLLERLQRKLDEPTYRRVIDASREDVGSDGADNQRH